VAYGIDHYYTASDDVDFMLRAGLEIIFETARFWASRVVYNRKRKRYEIRRVIGPDEFHEDVNNSAFVNTMAQWNLRKAKAYYESLGKTFPRHVKKICRKIALEESEVRGWDRIADRIAIPVSKSKGIIEEFDGYLKKRNIVLQQFDQHFMPVLPRDVEVSDFGKTQLIKQADIAMLMYLLPEHFTPAEKELNYRYYVARTLHKSSLSPSIYAIIGSEVGDIARGYLFFLHSLHADLRNTHGNTKEGIHGASLGGTWQAVVMGFCGFRIMHDMPSFEPRLPGHWQDVTFSLAWKRSLIEASVSNKRVNLFIRSKRKKGTCFVKCFNSVYKVPYNKAYTIRS
jgi:kojibiose phosphorylase